VNGQPKNQPGADASQAITPPVINTRTWPERSIARSRLRHFVAGDSWNAGIRKKRR
jgi:hypothetical protein